jgi:hypothetical protein
MSELTYDVYINFQSLDNFIVQFARKDTIEIVCLKRIQIEDSGFCWLFLAQ